MQRLKMYFRKRRSLIFFLTIACSAWSGSASGQQATIGSIVNLHARTFMRQPGAAGLSIGIYRCGESYTYHFGTVRKGTVPLGMRHTCLVLAPDDRASLATGYTAEGLPDTSGYTHMAAAGGLKSTVADLLRYLQAQVAERDTAIRLTRRESWGFDMGNGSRYTCGLNWQIITQPDGTRRIFQDGNLPGYSSKIAFLPEKDRGIVVLSNAFLPDELSALADGILDALGALP